MFISASGFALFPAPQPPFIKSNYKQNRRSRRERKLSCPGNHKQIMDAGDDDCCTICLDSATNRGKLECCDHLFCMPCILRWSKRTNTCPLCKQRFTEITHDTENGTGWEDEGETASAVIDVRAKDPSSVIDVFGDGQATPPNPSFVTDFGGGSRTAGRSREERAREEEAGRVTSDRIWRSRAFGTAVHPASSGDADRDWRRGGQVTEATPPNPSFATDARAREERAQPNIEADRDWRLSTDRAADSTPPPQTGEPPHAENIADRTSSDSANWRQGTRPPSPPPAPTLPSPARRSPRAVPTAPASTAPATSTADSDSNWRQPVQLRANEDKKNRSKRKSKSSSKRRIPKTRQGAAALAPASASTPASMGVTPANAAGCLSAAAAAFVPADSPPAFAPASSQTTDRGKGGKGKRQAARQRQETGVG